MMAFSVTFSTGGSAFDQPQYEVERILRKLADRVRYGAENDSGVLLDINGNLVGEWSLGTDPFFNDGKGDTDGD